MSKRIMQRSWSAGLALLLSGSWIGAAHAALDPLKLIPSESLFCAKLNDLERALNTTDQFLLGLAPMSVNALVKGQLGLMLGNPNTPGVDFSGDAALFAPFPGVANPMSVGLLIPTSDYRAFVDQNPAVSEADGDGVSTVGPFGIAVQAGEFILATTPENRAELLQARAMFTSERSDSVASALDAKALDQADQAPVWLYGNIALAGELFGPMLQGMLESGREIMAQSEEQGSAQAVMIMDLYASMLNTLLQEGQYLTLSYTPEPQRLRTALTLAARPETSLAQLFQRSGQRPQRELAQYLKPNATMAFVMRNSPETFQQLNEFYFTLMEGFIQDQEPAQLEELKSFITEVTASLDGTFAGTFDMNMQQPPPFRLSYVIGLRNPEQYDALMDRANELMNSDLINSFYQQANMEVTYTLDRKAESYRDVAIDNLTMTMKMELPEGGEEQEQMFNALYGDGLKGQLGVAEDLLLYTIGDGIQPLIDTVKADDSSIAPGYQAAFGMIEGAKEADFFMTYDVARLLQALSPNPQASEESIVIVGNALEGRITTDIAVPKSQIVNIIMAAQMLQQQQQQQ